MKKKTIHTGGKTLAGKPFMGEMMTCAGCRKMRKSDPKIESGWTLLAVDGKKIYLCPQCFSNWIKP